MDSLQFRTIIGRFATGITVVTTRIGDQVHGMTANAFCSVSLDPLLLLVCVERNARCHEQLQQSEVFGVNLLAEDQESLSNLFAIPTDPDQDLQGVPFTEGQTGVPLLHGCLGYFECRKHATHDGGDHTIFVGRVLHGELSQPNGLPLLYYAGNYDGLGR